MNTILNHMSPVYLKDDPTVDVKAADQFFSGLGVFDKRMGLVGAMDPDIQDSDGLVTYVVATTNPPPPEIVSLYNEIKPVMEGLTNAVVSAILKVAGNDKKKLHDPAGWREPLKMVTKAFCSGFSETSQHYSQRIMGVELAEKFMNVLMNAVVSNCTALGSFANFLKGQGDAIRAEITTDHTSFNYACVSIIHEILQAPNGSWAYVPKFKSYFTSFNQNNLKVASSCASAKHVHLDFDLNVMTGAFMVESWSHSSDFQQQTKAFIAKFQKLNVAESTNYFEGIFDSAAE